MNEGADYDRSGSDAEVRSGQEFVQSTIERLRTKLLDLATRNPLISFKRSARGRRYVRVIDELPNQLFKKLATDAGLRFKSLGRESSEPEDEKTVQFRRALAAARLEDEEYLGKLTELGDDPAEKATFRLDQELRQRVRERLGMPTRKSNDTAPIADVARRLNLNPSFDLPVSPSGDDSEDRHNDAFIQTLLYEDDLQLSLGRIREVVRLSIDEAGVNPLFCVFGFIEWYEDTHSETPLYAPLLLCPLHMDRNLVRGQYQYQVQSTGEDTDVNVAILERLKRDFEIVLPPFDEDETTPEEYFTNVQRVIDGLKGWKVRRWVTVGLFSFARIAMFHDLDPDKWNSEGGLHTHEGLSRLMGGGTTNGPANNVDENPDDEDGKINGSGEIEIPLIADADSSQVKALAEVLSGRSLVIEGPPGTGKSQTITNIIAASLAAGKTVLFLAEKMAALNVVRDRLSDAGLAEFCLELHSTKAGRKDTAAALARRLNRSKRAPADFELQATVKRLGALRDSLARTAEALGRPAGKLGITNQELLWRCHTARQRSLDLPSEVDELVLPGAEEITEIDIGEIIGVFDRFEQNRAQLIDRYGSVAKHPWNGVAHPGINPISAEDIVRRVKRLSEAAGNAGRLLDSAVAMTGIGSHKLQNLRELSLVAAIDPPSPLVEDSIVSALAQPQTLASMQDFAAKLGEYAELSNSLSTSFESVKAISDCLVKDLEDIASECRNVGAGDASVADLPGLTQRRQQQSAAWQKLNEFVGTIASRAGLASELNPQSEASLAQAVELASRLDPQSIDERPAALLTAQALATLQNGARIASELKERRAKLGERFELASLPAPGTLREHARALRAALLPFLSPACWRARRTFRGVLKTSTRPNWAAMAQLLDDLASYSDNSDKFLTDETLTKCVGNKFKGLDTQFEPLMKTASWGDEVRAKLPLGGEINNRLREFLFTGPPDQLESFASLARDPQMPVLQKVVTSEPKPAFAIAAQFKSAQHAAFSASRIGQAVQRSCLSKEVKISYCQVIAKNLARTRELRDLLDSAVVSKTVLDDRFVGHKSDPIFVLANTRYVCKVNAGGLPPGLQEWLLQRDAKSRQKSLRPMAEAAIEATKAVQSAISDLMRTVDVNVKAWLGSDSLMDTDALELRDHAARCAADPEGLQLLVDDLRIAQDVHELGLKPLLNLLELQRVPLKGLSNAARRVVFQSLAREAISSSPALANFSGDRHESLRKEFRELDHKLKRLRQSSIAEAVSKRQVDRGSDVGGRKQWTGLALIANETAKQTRHISVRDLMDRAGKAIQQLMPCFMMSPLSVAQFLKPGKLRFDLVVMDEASQLRPEDAVGAIGRARQMVIVGDPKQLPPTNFFREADSTMQEDDDEAAVDEQSILDQAMSVMRPARRLRWHYRSRHPSLIAFSNKEFYENSLVVFPSPYHDRDDFGVKYRYVADGVLRNRVNMPEAQAVAKAAIEYTARHPDRSLGIVTLNQPQAELLSLEIDRLATEIEEFDVWRQRREHSLERFFVKNLENVQGDERDTIFISTVYGPDEAGKREFAQRFGPINNQGGHRRLNVLFTRAKFQTIVFSSMDPAFMRTDESSAWGLRALKGYLKFAKDGILDIPTESGRSPDSDFEIAAIDILKHAGYEVVPQVGVVGYFIDLAVRHPNRPGEFAIGIECDGAAYHSSKSARDRDRLRQEVLERLRWRIHRIWSLDWYRNFSREKDRLLRAVAQAVASST